jgi:hypothetical protein
MAVIPKVRDRLRGVSGELFTPQTMPVGPYRYHQTNVSSSLPWTMEKKEEAALGLLRNLGVDPASKGVFGMVLELNSTNST